MARSALEIHYEDPDNKREAYRVFVTNVLVRMEGRDTVFHARDLSAMGIGVGGADDLVIGEPVLLSLYRNGTLIIDDLIARVARVEGGVTGLYFENLDRQQIDAVHAIVLFLQKEQLER